MSKEIKNSILTNIRRTRNFLLQIEKKIKDILNN